MKRALSMLLNNNASFWDVVSMAILVSAYFQVTFIFDLYDVLGGEPYSFDEP